jgi:hypothetical protein
MNRSRGCVLLTVALTMVTSLGCQRQLPPDRPANMASAMEIRKGFAKVGASSSSASVAPSQKPTGWATLRGTFKFEGTAPQRAALTVNKDVDVCAPGGRQVLSEALVVADDGGIKDVVIFVSQDLPNDDAWLHPAAKPGKTDTVVFDQKQCLFLTHVLAMQATQKLEILNSDPVGHNTNMSPERNSSFNSTIPVGGQAIYQPDSEERQPFSVTCSIHPWMQAWIITRNNSYFAVTHPDGSFEIPNLPSGVDLEFRIWQEKSRFVSSAMINGKPQDLPKGRLNWKLSATNESQNELDIRIPASVFQ